MNKKEVDHKSFPLQHPKYFLIFTPFLIKDMDRGGGMIYQLLFLHSKVELIYQKDVARTRCTAYNVHFMSSGV